MQASSNASVRWATRRLEVVLQRGSRSSAHEQRRTPTCSGEWCGAVQVGGTVRARGGVETGRPGRSRMRRQRRETRRREVRLSGALEAAGDHGET